MVLTREFFEWLGAIVLTLRDDHNFDMMAVGRGWYLENPTSAKSVQNFLVDSYQHERTTDEVVAEILRQASHEN
tara:strand:- start:240 stop:461 length:222 start_codon:yes stop_codon:yes gene_type:complete